MRTPRCSRLFGGLAELQRIAVGLADGHILRAILVTQRQCRRQGPDTLRVILGVLGIGVDFRRAYELEAGLLGQLDGVVLADIA